MSVVWCRKAWGSNQPDPRTRTGPQTTQSPFQFTAAYQSPYAASPSASNNLQSRKGQNTDRDQNCSKTGTAAAPGPLDDILGQVTDLLSQVNDILGRWWVARWKVDQMHSQSCQIKWPSPNKPCWVEMCLLVSHVSVLCSRSLEVTVDVQIA